MWIHDLAFIGQNTNVPGTYDSAYVLELGCLDIGVVERCHFFNLYASAAICYLNGPQWAWRDNSIMECCVDTSGLACLHVDGCNAIELDNSNFVDVGQLNNQVGLDKTALR